MAENKKSFILYADYIKTVSKLPDEKAGQLFKHILEYVNDKDPQTDDLLLEIAFEPIKLQLKRDLKKWESEIDAKKKAAHLGNLKRWHPELYESVRKNELSLADAISVVEDRKASQSDNLQSHPIAEIAVNDTVTVTVNDSNTKKKSIEDRKSEFKNSLHPHLEKYGRDLLNEFYSYWTEHGEKDKKMRFEKQKSFSLSRRLSTWKRNENKFNEKNRSNNRKGFESDTTQGAIEGAIGRLTGES